MDVLFALPVRSIFESMTKPTACGPLIDHGKFPESGLFFAHTEHLWKIDYIAKYNWRGPCYPEGEKRMWDILGNDLELLPLRGCRDLGFTKPGELADKWPEGIDYITHAHMPVNAEFLRMNGFHDLAELL